MIIPDLGAIVAFNVKTPKSIESEAAMHNVPIISSPIIYRLMEDVTNRVIELLPIVREAQVTGEATVMQLFDINVKSRIMKKIAGCRGRNGSLHKNQHIRVMRQGECVYEGMILSALSSRPLRCFQVLSRRSSITKWTSRKSVGKWISDCHSKNSMTSERATYYSPSSS